MDDGLLEVAAAHGCESLHLAADAASGLRAIVAVHCTVLGPALGGTRFRPYADERAAAVDVCRLAKGMTYKHAACGNDQGGGKAVIIGDPAVLRSDELLDAYGRFLEQLGGVYLTAEDVGTTQADMDRLRRHHALRHRDERVVGRVGRPVTGDGMGGVPRAWRAVGERVWGSPALAGRHVVVLGVGKVGSALARHLHGAGARLTLADVRADVASALAEELGADAVDPAPLLQVPCDVLAPCALGAVLSEETIPRLRCAAVCGAANNQLATDADAERLAATGIVYAPDYIVNAGGVINIADETAPGGYDRERAWKRVEGIADTVRTVFALADEHGVTTAAAADRLAEDRLGQSRR